ncbi:Acyl carrier protein [Cupriavidus sp. OV038]|jgi:acyl carrier protein|uniref:acyl carrier protein n=1 Tax=unclassified Cupriavidus TaxID=2640874 RepID=UPI0008EABF34|nr:MULTISPECIES: acyl carrier protein [unclassified Cupriavidus]SFC27339.1 Acyl carrier protein [Cupriavidus sp. OV038]SFP20116.1 Acyl carrier protein [Cupriavidus sp. OV096]
MKETIRQILAEVARLDVPIETLDDQADLYQAGLSSLATVHVMLAIENAFNIEIPDHMLTRQLFKSVNSLAAAASQLQEAA